MLDYDVLFRYIVVGDAGVGKTCLLLRFTRGEFLAQHDMTLGVDFGTRCLRLEDGSMGKIVVWDTAGQECFRSIVRAYYRGAAAVLLVYDVTQRRTFSHALSWLREVRDFATRPPVVVLVGNKSDTEARREVTCDEAASFAAVHGLLFIETSALSGHNVSEAFLAPVGLLLETGARPGVSRIERLGDEAPALKHCCSA